MYKHLYDNFKHWYHGGTVYFYSDPHFSDPEMKYLRKNYIGDEEQVKRINKVVGKTDTIIFLGDIGNIEFIKKIKGYKVLIQGNHDTGATNYKRQQLELKFKRSEYTIETIEEYLQEKYPGFTRSKMKVEIDEALPFTYWVVNIDNKLFDEVYEGPLMISEKIMLSHEPIDLPFVFNCHGHDHSNTQFKDDRHYNMCAENINYTPVCIKEIINSGKLKDIDSIHRQTIDRATEKKNKKVRISNLGDDCVSLSPKYERGNFMYPLTIEEVAAFLFTLDLDDDRFLSYKQIDKYADIVVKILAERDFRVRLDFGRNNTRHMLNVYSDFFSETYKQDIIGIELNKNITKENLYNTFCSYLDLKVVEAFGEIIDKYDTNI